MTDDELDALRSELGRLSGSERIRRQIELAQALTASYRRARAGDPSAQPYLEEAIEVLAEAYDHLEPGELLRGTVAAQAGWLLGVRYVNHGRSENDLETGIRLLEEALTFPESPYLPRATVLLVIGGLLLSRVSGPSLRSASMRDDADQAADYFQQVLDGLATNPEITSMAQNLLETARELQGPTGEIGRGSPPAEYAFDGPPLIDRDLPVPPATTSEPTALAPTEFDGPSGRVVSTGLAHAAPPNRTVPATRAAAPDTDYLFWFAVGRIPARDAIDDRFVELDLPDGTPAGARITVALFGFPGEIAITPGAEVGELVLRGDGSVVVDGNRAPPTVTGCSSPSGRRAPPAATGCAATSTAGRRCSSRAWWRSTWIPTGATGPASGCAPPPTISWTPRSTPRSSPSWAR